MIVYIITALCLFLSLLVIVLYKYTRWDIARREKAEALLLQSKQDWEDTFNTITDMITIHDSDYNIIWANKSAEKILNLPVQKNDNIKCFKYYHAADLPPEGCPSCRCLNTAEPAAFEIFEPNLKMFIEIRAIPRFDKQNRLIGLIHVVRDITGRKRAEEEREQLIRELKDALVKVKTLSGMLPICSSCKKIRNDKGYWEQVETYIRHRSDAEFSHGICPDCVKKVYPGYYDKIINRTEKDPEAGQGNSGTS